MDSAGLLVANPESFRILAEMMEISKKSFAEVRGFLKAEEDVSEKIAVLKAAKRCRIYRIEDYIVAATDVGCFEASAAMALVRLGADIGFAASIEKGKLMISGRADNIFVKNTGFDLPKDVFAHLAGEFRGEGGGHKAAAGFNGFSENAGLPLQKCVELAREFLGRKLGKEVRVKEYD